MRQVVLLTGCFIVASGCANEPPENPPAPGPKPAAINWDRLRDPDPGVRKLACQQLRDPRPATVHALVEMLRDPDPGVRSEARSSLFEVKEPGKVLALASALRSGDAALRYEAARALGELGRLVHTDDGFAVDIRPGTAELINTLNDQSERLRVRAAWALSRQDADEPRAVKALAEALASKEEEVLETALDALLLYSSRSPELFARQKGRPLVLSLLRILSGANATCRTDAAHLLGACGDSSAAVAQGLSAALADRDEKVRVAAAFSLSEIPGIEVPDRAFTVLCDFMDKEDCGWNDRVKACWALQRLNRFPACVVESAARRLADDSESVRFAAACLLSRYAGDHAARVEQVLLEQLGEYPSNRIEALQNLGNLKRLSADGLRTVRELLDRSDDGAVRAAAEAVLKKAAP